MSHAFRTALLASAIVFVLAACQKPAEPAATTPAATPATGTAVAPAISDQDISDAYVYLLGRLLVLRQEQLDFKGDSKWNEINHRAVGGVAWANPNLDVAYSEAWVAVDESSCTIFSVPRITGRYYTVQLLNGWGETVANINERNYPQHPSGDFWVCLKGANVQVPADAQRIDLPGKTARVLSRVELGANPKQAVALQHQIKVRASGTPVIAPVPDTPPFTNDKFPGVEAFDSAAVALDSEPDINPGMAPMQDKVRAIAAAVKDPAERARVDKVIRDKTLPEFFKSLSTAGAHGNGWNRPTTIGAYGDDYHDRTLVDLAGIWANVPAEAIYFKADKDGTGATLDGGNTYTMTFAKADLPAAHAKYFWSVIAVDAKEFRVIPNPKNRFLLNNQSKLEYGKDGSLTLYFGNEKPKDAPDGNWLPTPKGQPYNLTFRVYGPDEAVTSGKWFPAPMVKPN